MRYLAGSWRLRCMGPGSSVNSLCDLYVSSLCTSVSFLSNGSKIYLTELLWDLIELLSVKYLRFLTIQETM